MRLNLDDGKHWTKQVLSMMLKVSNTYMLQVSRNCTKRPGGKVQGMLVDIEHLQRHPASPGFRGKGCRVKAAITKEATINFYIKPKKERRTDRAFSGHSGLMHFSYSLPISVLSPESPTQFKGSSLCFSPFILVTSLSHSNSSRSCDSEHSNESI